MVNGLYLIKNYQMNEALKICDYKKWVKYVDELIYSSYDEFFKYFKDHDKKYYRLYFPLTVTYKNVIPMELKDYLGWNGYTIVDYDEGLIKKRGSDRLIRLGKYLNKNDKRLLKVYNDSKKDFIKKTDDIYVVISRHPYDIIGMSTDRGWTTCLDLDDKRYGGEHNHNLKIYLKGSLISYMIRKNDRNINNPISRVIIDRMYYGRLGITGRLYGTYSNDYLTFIREWINLYNDYASGNEYFKYKLDDFNKKY